MICKRNSPVRVSSAVHLPELCRASRGKPRRRAAGNVLIDSDKMNRSRFVLRVADVAIRNVCFFLSGFWIPAVLAHKPGVTPPRLYVFIFSTNFVCFPSDR